MVLIDEDSARDTFRAQDEEERAKRESDRPGALLTPKQRRFLWGLEEYSGDGEAQKRYQMRERIRTRFVNGLHDLGHLHRLDPGSREKILDSLGEPQLLLRASELLEFIYVMTGRQDTVNQIHETAVYSALSNHPDLRESSVPPGSVEVTTNVRYPPDIGEIAERADQKGLDALQPEEIGYLVQDMRLEPEELAKLYESSRTGELFDGVEKPENEGN